MVWESNFRNSTERPSRRSIRTRGIVYGFEDIERFRRWRRRRGDWRGDMWAAAVGRRWSITCVITRVRCTPWDEAIWCWDLEFKFMLQYILMVYISDFASCKMNLVCCFIIARDQHSQPAKTLHQKKAYETIAMYIFWVEYLLQAYRVIFDGWTFNIPFR